jgi:predicted CXXCH cytochrome family protein
MNLILRDPEQSLGRVPGRVGRFVERCAARLLLYLGVGLLASASALAQTQIGRTKHNLSVTGPGTIRTTEATGTCVFCHTPHNANPSRALWNRDLPPVTYQLYSSGTLQAQPDQPSGASRLCLSCHDGLQAVGNLRVPPRGAPIAVGPLTGKTLLGSNLSGDHPISFVYDSALALRHGQLIDPLALPGTIHLDERRQMQCTSCHDPHEDRQAMFLRLDNRGGALCTACHRQPGWPASSHATSNAAWNGAGLNPMPDGASPVVADNACMSCHRPHGSGHAQRLLAQAAEPANCTVCHGGSVATKNVEAEFLKPLHHPIELNQWSHEPRENPLVMPRHVACADCHNAHVASAAPGLPPAVSGRLQGVAGLSIAGTAVAEASFEYEVCLKCHGLREPTMPGVTRQSGTRNIRLKIDPANRSYHPVVSPGANLALLGLEAGYSTASVIGCGGCHNNDDWTPASGAPAGPHGSRFEPILERRYQTNDPTIESAQQFDLCYKCHNRDFLLNDRAGTFSHNRHVVVNNTPCAACHDAHGSRLNAGMVDFMLRDRTGKAVVTRSSVQGRLEFVSLGTGRGQCYLLCHGSNHEPKSYP